MPTSRLFSKEAGDLIKSESDSYAYGSQKLMQSVNQSLNELKAKRGSFVSQSRGSLANSDSINNSG